MFSLIHFLQSRLSYILHPYFEWSWGCSVKPIDPYSISVTCHFILDMFNFSSTVFNKSRKIGGSLGCSVDSLLYCGGENNNDANSYASSKFIGGRGRFKLNATSCSLDSRASVITIGGMFYSYEGISRVVLSWHACRYYHTLIVEISTWLSFVSSHPKVMLVDGKWSSRLG